MVSTGEKKDTDSSIKIIIDALVEITGVKPTDYLKAISSNPTHDLAIPSPQAMAVLGKLKAKYGFSINRNDITKTKKGSSCSVNLLAELVNQKT